MWWILAHYYQEPDIQDKVDYIGILTYSRHVVDYFCRCTLWQTAKILTGKKVLLLI
jgi:quinolinate synthase